jgi:hypothetical protein
VRDSEDADSTPDPPAPLPDELLPVATSFTVDPEQEAVRMDIGPEQVGRVTGRVTGSEVYDTRVWLETDDRTFVRVVEVANGSYRIGGLQPGTHYSVHALGSSTLRDPPWGTASFVATAGVTRQDIAMDRRALTLSGTVSGGGVLLRSHGPAEPPLEASSTAFGPELRSTGRYVVRGLVPGVYDVERSEGSGSSAAGTVTVTGPTTLSFDDGAEPGAYRARFVSGSAPIRLITARAHDAAGHEAYLSTDGRSSVAGSGVVAVSGLPAGTYRYSPSSFAAHVPADGNAPAVDGPWWFGGIASTFTIRAGRTTDDGTIALHAHELHAP